MADPIPDPPSDHPTGPATSVANTDREAVVLAGHRGDLVTVVDALAASEPSVRAAALGALGRIAARAPIDPDVVPDALARALADPDPTVRRRAAAEVARWAATCSEPTGAEPAGSEPTGAAPTPVVDGLLGRLTDDEVDTVTEVAAFACGELALDDRTRPHVVAALDRLARTHADSLCREAAVAALGSIGDPAGLTAVLHGCSDRATVRRRAVLALAAFDDPAATEALRRLVADRDLQVRQSAEELLAIESGETT
ncbi:MAG TPA: hypothetical protein PK623_10700 [Microthrixaceae bacterium]|nr:hypothetical protein [Microthrixaceae bacterium]HNE75375.1 hypothetical protein [Microthrixaceae bacterium]HPG15064.1 hypothetical protein [Microthrixaceae bacterium]